MSHFSFDGEFFDAPAKKEDPGSALMRLAAHARLFRSDDGIYYASVPVGDRQEIVALRSLAFRDWLIDAYVSEQGETPPRSALGKIALPLEARARYEPSDTPIFIRVGYDEHSNVNANVNSPGVTNGLGAGWLIDLGNSSGRAIGIEADGWSVVEQPGIHFRRPAGMMAFPSPARDGSIELLRPYVNLSGPDFQPLVARLGEAVGRALGWPAGSFLAAYHDNRRHATMAPIDESLVATALLHLIGPVVTEWTGTPTALLEALSKIVGKKHAASALWPKNPTKLGNELRRIAPQLRIHGVSVDFVRTHKGRVIHLKHEAGPNRATGRV